MTDVEKVRKLHDLFEKIQADTNYRNQKMGKVFVPGTGSIRNSPIAFVGEAPGRQEEEARSPFVGAAGKNLTKLLEHIGLSRDDVFITNVVKYRPLTPNGANRSPTSSESRYALPYLLEELEILSPQLVVCLGLTSAKSLLQDPTLTMSTANGMVFSKHQLRILVTYHPSPFNYSVPNKRQALFLAFQLMRQSLL